MSESNTKPCSHKFQAYYKRDKGVLLLEYMQCPKCERKIEAPYLVRLAGYFLHADTLAELDRMLENE